MAHFFKITLSLDRTDLTYRFGCPDEDFRPSKGILAGGDWKIPKKTRDSIDASATVPMRPGIRKSFKFTEFLFIEKPYLT